MIIVKFQILLCLCITSTLANDTINQSNNTSTDFLRARRDTWIVFPDPKVNRSIVVRETKTYWDIPTVEDTSNPIVISADYMDYESGTLTVREGKRLMISCLFERDDLAHKSDLAWKKSGGHIIDGESSPSLFSVVLDHGTKNHKKTSLHFNSIHERDSGFYICSARTVGGETFERTIKITVLPKVQWNNPEHTAGALIGEPLTVDCGIRAAEGKEPTIQVTSGNGEQLDGDIFKIAGNEATIDSLEKEHAGLVVSCVTIEFHKEENGEDYPIVDRKDVRIEVYHKPEFATEESVQYTVIDDHERDVFIHCNVTSSNPSVRQYTFFHNDQEIHISGAKYNILKHVGHRQSAKLHIRGVTSEDLGTYRCEASNTKAKSHHNIHLRQADSPSEPKVTFVHAKKHSITWRIESIDKESDMPIKFIEIRHLRASQADLTNDADEDIKDEYWRHNSILVEKSVAKNDLYEVTGLRHAHEYVWRFRQVSEAGFGDSVVTRAKTFDENDLSLANSSVQTVSSMLVLLVTIFML